MKRPVPPPAANAAEWRGHLTDLLRSEEDPASWTTFAAWMKNVTAGWAPTEEDLRWVVDQVRALAPTRRLDFYLHFARDVKGTNHGAALKRVLLDTNLRSLQNVFREQHAFPPFEARTAFDPSAHRQLEADLRSALADPERAEAALPELVLRLATRTHQPGLAITVLLLLRALPMPMATVDTDEPGSTSDQRGARLLALCELAVSRFLATVRRKTGPRDVVPAIEAAEVVLEELARGAERVRELESQARRSEADWHALTGRLDEARQEAQTLRDRVAALEVELAQERQRVSAAEMRLEHHSASLHQDHLSRQRGLVDQIKRYVRHEVTSLQEGLYDLPPAQAEMVRDRVQNVLDFMERQSRSLETEGST